MRRIDKAGFIPACFEAIMERTKIKPKQGIKNLVC
jgi:hypothetical protein